MAASLAEAESNAFLDGEAAFGGERETRFPRRSSLIPQMVSLLRTMDASSDSSHVFGFVA